MQAVFDFVSGKMPFDEFYEFYQSNPSVGAWLNQLTNFNEPYPPVIERNISFRSVYNIVRKKGEKISDYLAQIVYNSKLKGFDLAATQCGWFSGVATPVLMAYPTLKQTRIYKQNADYYLDAAGNSIGGKEVDELMCQILDKFPPTMKVAERTKAGKEALWKAFHIKDRKFPRWAQGADWPMGKNSPMEYLGQRRDGELVELRFRDVDTGEERTVEQYY